MTANLTNEILQLSIPERLELIENIWESIEAVPDAIELTDAQRRELDRRLELYRQNPRAGATWEEVKQRIKIPDLSFSKLVNHQKKATAKCVLKTDGYQAIFDLDKTKDRELIDLVVEFQLDPKLQELSLKSVSSFIYIDDLERLATYLEKHIASLRENQNSVSEIFMDYSLAFQMQAYEGDIDPDIEGFFSIQILVNLGMYDRESSRTYVGGISVISLENAENFISSIRNFISS